MSSALGRESVPIADNNLVGNSRGRVSGKNTRIGGHV
jgi:hypothetical protein